MVIKGYYSGVVIFLTAVAIGELPFLKEITPHPILQPTTVRFSGSPKRWESRVFYGQKEFSGNMNEIRNTNRGM